MRVDFCRNISLHESESAVASSTRPGVRRTTGPSDRPPFHPRSVPDHVSSTPSNNLRLICLAETPRYLSWMGKNDEAWAVIRKIHHDPTDPIDASARAEFIQITKQVEHDRKQKAGYIEMFTKPSWRRRSLLVMFLL